jgi:hypothetical protein
VPVNLRYCVLAVRAFNAEHVMIESELVEGQQQLESAIERLFSAGGVPTPPLRHD